MKYLLWLLKAAIFFTLFAFALNNQQVVALNFFFGTYWLAPMVLVVLAAFCAGLALGILVMVPRWWQRRRQQTTTATSLSQSEVGGAAAATPVVASANRPATPPSSDATDPPHGI